MRRSLAVGILVATTFAAPAPLLVSTAAASTGVASTGVASTGVAPIATGTPPGGDDAPPVTNDFMDLDRDVSDCISAMPKPGCGREPTSSGDRGGWQQILLFGVLMLGMAGIGTRVAFSVRARDRASASEQVGTERNGS